MTVLRSVALAIARYAMRAEDIGSSAACSIGERPQKAERLLPIAVLYLSIR